MTPLLASSALALLAAPAPAPSPVTAEALSGGTEAVTFLGVTLVGVSATTGVKLLFTGMLILLVLALRRLVLRAFRRLLGGEVADPRRFWARQILQVVTAVVLALGIVSIWITPQTDISTGIGLISAGLAFALQRVILSFAAYVVILRGDVFTLGDRIDLGGVRGDVVRLGFLKTTIMEMGQPPSVASADPAVWVHSRQYTGRIVTVTNGVIFNEPVYNYTRDFPYIWEEMVLPIAYADDRARVEAILLGAAREHAVVEEPGVERALHAMRLRYALSDASTEPAVYWRITDNWVELSLRFLVHARGVRDVKDAMTRQVLTGLDEAGIGIASATFEVVKVPPLRMDRARGDA